jgi:hypothetical protein
MSLSLRVALSANCVSAWLSGDPAVLGISCECAAADVAKASADTAVARADLMQMHSSLHDFISSLPNEYIVLYFEYFF